jgi:hypothetical protein
MAHSAASLGQARAKDADDKNKRFNRYKSSRTHQNGKLLEKSMQIAAMYRLARVFSTKDWSKFNREYLKFLFGCTPVFREGGYVTQHHLHSVFAACKSNRKTTGDDCLVRFGFFL